MKNVNINTIQEWETRFRANFINSLSGFKSAALIGTKNKQGHTNLAIFSSIVHIGSNPPLLAMIVRPDISERHTLENILESKVYTINHIHPSILEKAHQTAARYSKDISEYSATGLTEEYHNNFYAPYVQEARVKIGMEFKEKIELKINHTIMIIGQVLEVHYPSGSLCADGYLDIEKAGTITCSGLDSYHTTDRITRLSYPKTDQVLKSIKLMHFE